MKIGMLPRKINGEKTIHISIWKPPIKITLGPGLDPQVTSWPFLISKVHWGYFKIAIIGQWSVIKYNISSLKRKVSVIFGSFLDESLSDSVAHDSTY